MVLASHLPGEGVFRSQRFEVVPILCQDDFDFWSGVAAYWETDATIVNLEHDIEATDDHLEALFDCPHPLCWWAYRCHWVTTHRADDTYPALVESRRVTPADEWADWAPLGLLKITPQARTAPLARTPWVQLERSVNAAVAPPYHLHWPEVQHHHW